MRRHPSAVAYWIRKHGLRAVGQENFRAKGGPSLETLTALVAEGASLARISTRVGVSVGAVRYWLGRYEFQTQGLLGRPDTREAREAGVRETLATCRHHGLTTFVRDRRGYFKCRACRAEAVMRRRRRMKAILVAEAGGVCRLCGYDGSPGALDFHHVDPTSKEFHLSRGGITRSLERARAEARKCVLLCANCHREVEARTRSLP